MIIKILIWDIETYLEFALFKFYNPETNQYYEFRFNRWSNQLDGLMKFLEIHKDYYLIGYNSLSFDAQVLEWTSRNNERWNDLTGLEIAARICQKAQDTIDNSNYEVFPEYRESELSWKHIDIFRVNHWDNKNARVSLKRLMFEMDMELLEELPIPFDKKGLTKEEVEKVSEYCTNDCLGTYKGWLYTIGECDHPLYKGNNQIQIRFDIQEKYGISCLNYSNAKIGDEIIKKYYCEAKHIEYRNLPRKGFFRKQIELKYCIPKTISFKTKELQKFLRETKAKIIKIDEDFEQTLSFYGQNYTFAKGGLHNTINGKVYTCSDDIILRDVDVSGWYPAIIINNQYFPFHLGKEFLVGYSKCYYERIPLKPLAKKDPKIKGIVEALKQAGNCPYGKSGDMQSWLYDKQLTLATCLTGEFGLLMLIEECELNGIRCIMANTDGCTFLLPKDKVELFNKIKTEWLDKISKELRYEIEEVDYEKMVFSTVNDYLAIKTDKSIKLKGDFTKDFLLRMNKSKRIIGIALEKYYNENIPIKETIENHKYIYDFCIRQKASKDFHYEGVSKNGTNKYKKLIRYYISKEGESLFKIKNSECQTNAAEVSIIEKNELTGKGYLCKVCNYLPKVTKVEDCNLDYQFYIDKAQKIIDKIRLEGKKAVKQQPKEQLSLGF